MKINLGDFVVKIVNLQYPLPAQHTDESSIDGTLEVIETLIRKVLKLDNEKLVVHGPVICAEDQLTNLLVDKVCGFLFVLHNTVLSSL